MPPRHSTSGRLLVRAEPQITLENTNPPVEDAVAQALHRMADVVQNIARPERWEEPRSKLGKDLALERFLKFKPLLFIGKPNLEWEAETWVEQMEDIFVVLRYSDQRKIKFAAFRLEGPVRDWWVRRNKTLEMEQRTWDWDEFVSEFNKKFIPQWVVEKRGDDFQNYKQEEKPVGDYAAELARLSKYAFGETIE
jgi:hypothetical protein